MSRHTVLQIIPELDTGGAERTTVDIAAALSARGDRALVASSGGRLVEDLKAAGGEHITLPLATKSPARMWRNARILRRLIADHHVDLVHARSRAPAWSALWAARRARLPFVTTYHGIYSQTNRAKALYNSVMARGDAVIANSRYTAKLVADRHPFAADRIMVVYRGSSLDALDPSNVRPERVDVLRQAWDIPQGVPLLINIARLTAWKGQRVLIDALARLARSTDRPFVAVLAGDAQGRNAYLAELTARAAAAGLSDRIRFPGHCADVPAALALADLAIVASVEPEAFGRAAVEAQAAGVPIIATDLGAAPETVLAPPDVAENRRTGWRVPPGNPEALAHAINDALTLAAPVRASLTHRARSHVEAMFSLKAMCDATLDIYDGLLTPKADA